jgi:hypothetical protein
LNKKSDGVSIYMTYVAVVVNRYGFVVSSILARIAAAARCGRIPRG